MLTSTYDDWPTKDLPGNRYKFTSISLYLSSDATIIERSTYSVLDWLGDIGGLGDALRMIFGFLMTPLAAFALKVELLASSFKYLKRFNIRCSDSEEESKRMTYNFTN